MSPRRALKPSVLDLESRLLLSADNPSTHHLFHHHPLPPTSGLSTSVAGHEALASAEITRDRRAHHVNVFGVSTGNSNHSPSIHRRARTHGAGSIRIASAGPVPNLIPKNSPTLVEDPQHLGVFFVDLNQNHTVPVGTVLSYGVSAPYGSPSITMIEWDGAPDYGTYFGDSYSSVAATSMEMATNYTPPGQWLPDTSFQFLVGPVQQNYTINVNVKYSDGTEGSAVIEFSSVAPTVTLSDTPSDKSAITVGSADPTKVTYGNPTGVPGISFTAQTTAAADFGGDFMYLQTVAPARLALMPGNTFLKPDIHGSGPLIDNIDPNPKGQVIFPNITPLAYGYITNPQGTPGNQAAVDGWTLAAGKPATYLTNDTPGLTAPAGSVELMVGSRQANPYESYEMYVMYKPNMVGVNANWVALAVAPWGWAVDAAKNTATNLWSRISSDTSTTTAGGAYYANPTPGQAAMNASEYFPSWTDRTSDLVQRSWIPG